MNRILTNRTESRRPALFLATGLLWGFTAGPPLVKAADLPTESRTSPVRAPAGHSTRLILLGTGGGPIDRKDRSQPATLLVVDGRTYLIDAGAGVVWQIARAGFQPHQIGHIFFTHYHLDHDAGLPALVSFIWMDRNMYSDSGPAVQIYGPPATRFLVRSSLAFLSVSERVFSAEITRKPAAPMFEAHSFSRNGPVYGDDRICVTAVQNTHYHFKPDSLAYGMGDESFAYRFQTPAGSIVYTGDTGPSAAVTKLATGANVLVSEVINEAAMEKSLAKERDPKTNEARAFHMHEEHLPTTEVGKMAARAHVGLVILTHIAPGRDGETNMTMYTAGVEKYYSGPVIAGKDLFEYDLYRATPEALTCGQ